MNFDIKDVKSWANRHDVKVGDVGFVTCTVSALGLVKATIKEIFDDDSRCFLAQPLDRETEFQYSFFLPLDKVKEDKPKEKKYRPIKSMNDLTRAVYNISPSYANLMNVGDVLYVKRKYNNHYYKLLITHLDFDENHNLVSINGESLRTLFENYEIKNVDDDLVPFGVEIKEDE